MLHRFFALAASALLILFLAGNCTAAGPFQDPARSLAKEIGNLPVPTDGTAHKEPQRLVAAGLALTLGAFGAHRLYLGTDAKVPIIYGLTFGGFGVLALIDLGQILFTKDLHSFRNNNQVFMWGKGRSEELTPP
ncbi:MAG: TM2 domain-containing protein [Bacteroidetes bacterium]|nr:TM2 domain-containing protein [Bacteroidota bacterium]MBS1942616.1 TM2 domain-containing protein [Bacteroidota bacterium]